MNILQKKILNKLNLKKLFKELGLEINEEMGNELNMLCPFHDEIDPSLNFNKELGIFHCFGCKISGNLISFVAKLKEISYIEALNFLKEKAGLEVSKIELKRRWKILSEQKDKKVEKEFVHIQNPPKNLIILTERGFQWLRGRGIKKSTARNFKISFCINGFYKDRAIIPIYNHKNKYQFFEARLIRKLRYAKNSLGQIELEKKVRYPLDAPVSENLFNLDKAKEISGYVILVEGIMDVLYLFQLGYNVVGSFGTNLSPTQISLLTKFFKKIYICFDSDKSGKEAIREVAEDILPLTRLKIIRLPEGKDPDEISGSFFHTFFKQAIDADKLLSEDATIRLKERIKKSKKKRRK